MSAAERGMEVARRLGTRAISTQDDRFAAQMIPHHEAAVLLASEILQRGQDPEMLTLARRIVESQQAEIVQMREFLRRRGHAYVTVPPSRFDVVAGALGAGAMVLGPPAVGMVGAMLAGAAVHSYLMKAYGHL